MKPTVKYFMYPRKSTDDKKHQVLSLPGQISELTSMAKREQCFIYETIEESMTAKKPGRPRFNEMLDRIDRGEANGILCWKIDRLYRNPVDEGRVRWMLQQGVIASIRTPTREYRPQDAGLLMAVESGMAVEHILSMATALKRTFDEKLRRGQWPGVKVVGFMFDHASKNITPDPKNAPTIRALFEEFETGRLGLQAAGMWLSERGIKTRKGNPLSKSHVHGILTDSLYMGIMKWKGKTYEGKYTPVVSAEIFERVQKAIKVKSKPRKVRNGHNFPFCGIFRCSCGAMMTAQWAKGHGGLYRYYRCSRKANQPCTEPYVREEHLASQALEKLRPFAISEQEAVELHCAIDAEAEKGEGTFKDAIAKTDEALEPLEEQLRNLTRLLLKGIVDEDTYLQSKEQLLTEKTRLKQERLRLCKSRELRWVEPGRKLVNDLQTLGKTETEPDFAEFAPLVQRIGTNHLISRKNVTFSFSEDYDFVPSLLASVRVASSNQSSPQGDKNWWSTKWCIAVNHIRTHFSKKFGV
jgi:site-specific DNA recombinase